MVAVKAGRLTHTDLFPGVLWNQEQWNRKLNEITEELDREGYTDPDLFFRARRVMEEYQQAQPSMRQRQEIAKRVLGPSRAEPSTLTREELEYVLDKLRCCNVELGVSAAAKLEKLIPR